MLSGPGKFTPIIVVLVALVGACGSDPEPSANSTVREAATVSTRFPPGDSVQETVRFCSLIKEWAELDQKLDDTDSPGAESLYLKRVLELFKEVPENAPASIEAAMRVIVTTDPDPVVISEGSKRDQAEAEVDALIARACDVRFSFDGYDFREGR